MTDEAAEAARDVVNRYREAPITYDDSVPPPTKPHRVSGLTATLLAMFICFGVALWVVYLGITGAVLTNRETGYKNRAVVCQVLVNEGRQLPDVCLEPNVVKFYQPTSAAAGP